jgi:hypothetical protein
MSSTSAPPDAAPHKSSPWLGVLPFIGVILFVIHAFTIVTGSRDAGWERDLVEIGVVYMIGVAGIGGGISHILFGPKISRSIGWEQSPFEFEVGVANLGFGVAGCMASSYSPDFWLAVIVANGVFRVGCGVGHIRAMVKDHNFAINNTAILFLNFVVPAFLYFGWQAWA